MKLLAAALLACLAISGGPALAQTAKDADTIADCVNKKAGPEGDLPSSGPLRQQFIAEMAGGPQMCVGLIYDACMKATKDSRQCNRREAAAWIEAIKLTD